MSIVPDFAFPFELHQKFTIDNPTVSSQGLSKREYFAAVALQGILSNTLTGVGEMTDEQLQTMITQSVLLADMMVQTLAYPYGYDYATQEYGDQNYPLQGQV